MPVGALNPIDFAQSWDFIFITGVQSPGVCEVSEAERAFEWDVKKGKGAFGGTATFVQRPPAKFSVTFKLWTAAHFTAWDAFLPLLKYDPTKKSVQAVEIYHPSLADIDIYTAVTESIGNYVHQGDQLYTRTVKFLEYFPPPKASAVSTPSGAKAATNGGGNGGAGTQTPDAQDAQQKEIADLLKQAQAP